MKKTFLPVLMFMIAAGASAQHNKVIDRIIDIGTTDNQR
jgi:hypothetical protein